MDRRRFLVALGALAAAPAWARRNDAVVAVPEGPITLGWRWVPGETLTYRCVTRREAADRVTSRAEEWTWLVRDVDRGGVATLEGRLTGFGGGVRLDEVEAGDDALATAMAVERAHADQIVTLRIGLDGRLVWIDALPFADALPHRLLALRVPAGPIAEHDEWPLPGLVRPFAALVPADVQSESRATGRLVDLAVEDDRVVATLETLGTVRTAGPTIHVSGTARWDVGHGGLLDRDVLVRFTPSTPDPASNPGTLAVTLTRVRG